MEKTLLTLVASGVVLAAGSGSAIAQEDDDDSAVPVEMYACSYNEGMGPADLDAATAKWNAWADTRELNDYSAWTLTPFYSGVEQDFDVLWLGVAPTGQAMGAAQDDWIANGGEINAEFEKAVQCNSHGMYAAVQFKEPPERDDPSSVILAFSDCNIGEGRNFMDDVAPAVTSWSEFRSEQGSKAGYWVFFPVYGGGGEEFDFKFVASHGNFEEQGVDYDNWDGEKARETFPQGLLECDSSRVYVAQNRRMAESDDE